MFNLQPSFILGQVIVNDVPGQEVEFDLYDKDVDKDDFLGR